MHPESVLSLDEIRLSEMSFWRRPLQEREGAFQTLRRERPLSFHEEGDTSFFSQGPGFWAVTRHAHILEVSRDAKLFCSGRGATSIGDMPAEFLEFFGSMINMDDPKHKRLRGLVAKAFTPRQIRQAEDRVREAAVRVIDEVAEKGECDFVTDIAAPFPIRIICDMMGIPESQHSFVFERTNLILGAADSEYVSDPEQMIPAVLAAGRDLKELMDELRQPRIATPTEDLTSALIHAEVDGDRLTDQEIGSFFILLCTAGNETTRNAISHGMKALCDHPDQRAIWQSDFEGVKKMAVEEIVRWASPVIFMRRTATGDTRLGDEEIREGDKLLLFYSSGNRDDEVFEAPFRFDVRRSPNEHVGFGGPGAHFCLGANLARREIEVLFREIFDRLPDLEITGEPERLHSAFIHGIKHMPCSFTPGHVLA